MLHEEYQGMSRASKKNRGQHFPQRKIEVIEAYPKWPKPNNKNMEKVDCEKLDSVFESSVEDNMVSSLCGSDTPILK